MGTRRDRIVTLGRELGRCWEALTASEEAEAEHRQDRALALKFRREGQLFYDRIKAIENLIAQIQARTLEGALVQIMLAQGIAAGGIGAEYHTEADAEEDARQVHALLYSAFAAVEAEAGISREAFGGGRYMPRELNPHSLRAGQPRAS